MVCDNCEKKLGRVITPDTWKDGARNTTESGGRKLNENKALTSKKASQENQESRALASAESARALFTNQDLTTARAVPTRKGSVRCVGRRFWTPRTTSRPPSDSLLTGHQYNQRNKGRSEKEKEGKGKEGGHKK
uniref:Cysteine-rich PDZ-binding protein n=1 Tax=Oncorhynchus tshawytscha TaxID=74940 RepID=A0AAZ3Q9I3_ONCTS